MEAVVFDYDGTLVQLNIDFGLMRHGVEKIMARYGVDAGNLRGLYILEMIDEAARLISEKDPLEGSSFYRKSLELVTAQEVRAAKNGKILPGVINMLKHLGERGIKVGVVTRNCNKAVKMVFPQIEQFCDIYVPRDGVTRVKPDPQHLAIALEKLEVNSTAHCLMVGDHILDIEVGKQAKMKTAGVLTGKTTREQFIVAGADYVWEAATKILEHFFEEKRL